MRRLVTKLDKKKINTVKAQTNTPCCDPINESYQLFQDQAPGNGNQLHTALPHKTIVKEPTVNLTIGGAGSILSRKEQTASHLL